MSTAFLPGFEQFPLGNTPAPACGCTGHPYCSCTGRPAGADTATTDFPAKPRQRATSPSRSGEVAKGVDSTDTLATPHGCGDEVVPFQTEQPPGAKGLHTVRTLGSNEGAGSNPTPSVRAIDFQVQAFTRSLSRQERAAVAARPRFRSMPWLCRADLSDHDDLP